MPVRLRVVHHHPSTPFAHTTTIRASYRSWNLLVSRGSSMTYHLQDPDSAHDRRVRHYLRGPRPNLVPGMHHTHPPLITASRICIAIFASRHAQTTPKIIAAPHETALLLLRLDSSSPTRCSPLASDSTSSSPLITNLHRNFRGEELHLEYRQGIAVKVGA